MRRLSVTDVSDKYGIPRSTVRDLLHSGAFGPKGVGYVLLNPDAQRPTYRITDKGLKHYERRVAA